MSQALPVNFTFCEGNYRIEKFLGRTNNGYSYLAKDVSLDRLVAINEFFPEKFCLRNAKNHDVNIDSGIDMALFEQLKGLFLKEAREMAQIDCPNVVQVHDAFEENSTAYYVTDYVEGQYLSEIVNNRPIEKRTAVKYILLLGQVLKFMQSHFSRTLNVGPENVIIRNSDGQPIAVNIESINLGNIQKEDILRLIDEGRKTTEILELLQRSMLNPVQELASTLYYLISVKELTNDQILNHLPINFGTNFPPEFVVPITSAITDPHKQLHEFLEEVQTAFTSIPSQDSESETQNEQDKTTSQSDSYDSPNDTSSSIDNPLPESGSSHVSKGSSNTLESGTHPGSITKNGLINQGSVFTGAGKIFIGLILVGIIGGIIYLTSKKSPEEQAIGIVKEYILAASKSDVQKMISLLDEDYFEKKYKDNSYFYQAIMTLPRYLSEQYADIPQNGKFTTDVQIDSKGIPYIMVNVKYDGIEGVCHFALQDKNNDGNLKIIYDELYVH